MSDKFVPNGYTINSSLLSIFVTHHSLLITRYSSLITKPNIMKKNIYFVLVFLQACLLNAQIVETKKMEQILSHISPDTLVIFDLDNTLLEPVQELGSDQYYYSRIQDLVKQGHDTVEARKKALREWSTLQCATHVKLCEPGSDKIVKEIQDKKIMTMGLTTRGLGMSTRTIEQLESLNIDLTKTAPSQEEFHFMNANSAKEVHGVLYKSGILFTAGTDKGEALRKFLEKSHTHPKAIVFINDKESHLSEVEKYAEAHKIPFIGLRYGYTDEKVKNFRKDLADIQREHFGKILSNEEAEKLLQQKKT